MIETFKNFMADPKAFEMFIEGQAGTGKTTSLAHLVELCKEEDISYIVTAHTHKACGILNVKLPQGANIKTTHSFLKKRPGINEHATKKEHVNISTQHGTPGDVPRVWFLDEFSQLGEKDYMDIGAAQDPNYEGLPKMKIVYIGDPNQLPPVGDTPAIVPHEPYWVKLTHIYRQANDSGLLDPLCQLVDFINGATPVPLIESSDFIRRVDIVKEYMKCDEDKVLLAWTNKRVESLNANIRGYATPDTGDNTYSPTLRAHFEFEGFLERTDISYIDRHFNDPLGFGSKYKTLEHLFTIHDSFCVVTNEDGENEIYAIEFGHYQYKLRMDELAVAAADANKAIENKHGMSGATFAKQNKTDPLSRARAKAWRDYLTYKECVVCMDFPFAMTVHKSQGSTYNTVFIDTEDLSICADMDYKTYLKLLYVSISRASNKVYTN